MRMGIVVDKDSCWSVSDPTACVSGGRLRGGSLIDPSGADAPGRSWSAHRVSAACPLPLSQSVGVDSNTMKCEQWAAMDGPSSLCHWRPAVMTNPKPSSGSRSQGLCRSRPASEGASHDHVCCHASHTTAVINAPACLPVAPTTALTASHPTHPATLIPSMAHPSPPMPATTPRVQVEYCTGSQSKQQHREAICTICDPDLSDPISDPI